MRGGDVIEPEQEGQRVAVDAVVEVRVLPQRLQLRSEHQRLAGPAVIQRLLADPVAGQPQALLGVVPQGDGEHAVGALQGVIQPPGHERGQQHLGVRVTAEGVAQRLQFGAQGGEVVDLAVVGHHIAAVGRGHRLVAQR
ncbi:hypothetical protein D3C72_1361880 [compost metagenome]